MPQNRDNPTRAFVPSTYASLRVNFRHHPRFAALAKKVQALACTPRAQTNGLTGAENGCQKDLFSASVRGGIHVPA